MTDDDRAHALPTWPDELKLLVGDDAGELLAAVAGAAGSRLERWHARQVNHQPGRSTVVQYDADLRHPDGTTTTETLVATTGLKVPDGGAAIFDDGATRAAVWRWPADPFLPGLPAAIDPARVGALLDDLGIGGGAVSVRIRAYRPGRRAVVEVTGSRGRLFLKVLRPAKVEALHDVHRDLARHLPVPDSLGWTDDGVVVLTAIPGRTLREAMRTNQPPPPGPDQVVALLDRLPASLADQPERRGLVSAAEHHATVIAATVPAVSDRVDEILDAIRPERGDPGPVVPVHGDLYEAQVLCHAGRVTGLLDVDTAGAGRRIDDLANFCAHLSVLALDSDRSKLVKRYGAAVLAEAERDHDRSELRRRIAAAVLSLSTGPFRVLEPGWSARTRRRLDLAAEWLTDDSAG
ncbi:MAG: phosphotransferase [Acidimicrobiales bacterium]|nr:phosphotransferase [Acidimicrobiales bacterium]